MTDATVTILFYICIGGCEFLQHVQSVQSVWYGLNCMHNTVNFKFLSGYLNVYSFGDHISRIFQCLNHRKRIIANVNIDGHGRRRFSKL